MTTAQASDIAAASGDDNDAKLTQQLVDELNNTSLDDDGLEDMSVSSSSSGSSTPATKMQANLLSPIEQEAAGKLLSLKRYCLCLALCTLLCPCCVDFSLIHAKQTTATAEKIQ